MEVRASGTIESIGSNLVVKTGGGTLNLSMSGVKISAGYIPEPGDKVAVVYDKNSMKALDLQLIDRPAPPAEDSSGDGGDDGGE